MTDNNLEDSQINNPAEPVAVGEPQPAESMYAEPQILETANLEPVPSEPVRVEEPASLSRLTPGAIFFGVLITVGLIAFVLLARITVHPFDQINQRMRVIDVWRRLRNHLPDVAHPTLLGIVFDIAMILIVVGSIACIWLALMATDQPADQNEPPARPDPVAPGDLQPLESGQ